MSKYMVLFLAVVAVAGTDFDQHLDVSADEYKARRLALRQKLDHPTVFMGNILRNRINDTEYEFRQESYFYYLTGLNEPDAYLVLSPEPFLFEDKMVHELLFINEPNQRVLTWIGKRVTVVEAMDKMGFEMAAAVYEGSPWSPDQVNRFETFLKGFTKTAPKFHLITPIINYHVFGQRRPSYHEDYKRGLLRALEDAEEGIEARERPLEVLDGAAVIEELTRMRSIKSEREREMLQRAVDITLSGHRESLKIAKDVPFEYQVESAIEFAFKYNGAAAVGYNSIVGCGPNGTVLHYDTNRDKADKAQMYVLDAGAEYRNYTADITRSFPADGTFSKEQGQIYNLVLAAQQAGAEKFVAGANYNLVLSAIKGVLSKGLVKLGVIEYPRVEKKFSEMETADFFRYSLAEPLVIDGQTYYPHNPLRAEVDLPENQVLQLFDEHQFRQVCPHGWGHSVGLDVHDPSPRTFAEGMIWTIEPGIYISERLDFPVDKAYLNIGVRIEDMYLITKTGNTCMSEQLPRDIEGLEAFMKQKSHLLLRGHDHQH